MQQLVTSMRPAHSCCRTQLGARQQAGQLGVWSSSSKTHRMQSVQQQPKQHCLAPVLQVNVKFRPVQATYRDDVQPVPDLPAPEITDLDSDRQWIASMITTWLDDEWTPLEVHQELGRAAGTAYVTCRNNGDEDMSSLVVGLASELLAFNYRETFVNAFEVANKVVEMLMMREGVPVCCVSDDDVARIERFASSSDASSSSSSSLDASGEERV